MSYRGVYSHETHTRTATLNTYARTCETETFVSPARADDDDDGSSGFYKCLNVSALGCASRQLVPAAGFDGNEITASARTSSQPFQGVDDDTTLHNDWFNRVGYVA